MNKLSLIFVVLFAGLLLPACGKDGAQGAMGPQGIQGVKGDKGDTGDKGEDGVDGRDGIDATVSAYSIVAIVDPCGDAPGVQDEVILKLANGQYLVSYSENANGKNTRFSVLSSGSYMTTDGTNCVFTIP